MNAAIDSFVAIIDTVITMVSGNTTLMVFMCAGLVGMAISSVKKLVGRY